MERCSGWKEMKAVWIAFEVWDADVKHLPGYKKYLGMSFGM